MFDVLNSVETKNLDPDRLKCTKRNAQNFSVCKDRMVHKTNTGVRAIASTQFRQRMAQLSQDAYELSKFSMALTAQSDT